MADFPVVLDAETLNGTNGFTILAPDGTGGIEVIHIRGSIPGELAPGFISHPTNNLVITAFRFGEDFAGRPVTEVGAVQFIAGRNAIGQPADFPSIVGTFSTGGPPQAPPRGDRAEAMLSVAAAEEAEVSGIVGGIDKYDITGFSAASAGDVNGDGFQDFMISAPGADPDGNVDSPVKPAAGVTYVVFGSAGTGTAGFGFAGLDGSNGFRIDGAAAYDTSGWSVDGVGDFNGDGHDDMLIGANRAAPGGAFFAGASYVVFGSGDPFAASMSLAALDGANGFGIDGLDASDGTGASVAGAGDVNGDGLADIIIGAAGGDPDGGSNAGESYVVFGSDTPFDASFDLTGLDGENGFRIDGAAAADRSGFSVDGAGDINGDGFDDLIVGAYNVDVDGDRTEGFSYQGAAYVVFGSGAPFAADLDLAALDGSDGFRMRGDAEDSTAQTGYSVASAGDVNGDGFDDLIIGALRARTNPNEAPSGAAYIVFGSAAPFAADFDLRTLDGNNGFRVNAVDLLDYLGSSVSSAGDVNGDGFDDIAIGARGTEEAYVIFGRAPTTAVSRVGSAADQDIRGGDFNDTLEGGGGADTLIGGDGDDRYRVDNSLVSVVEVNGGGTDRVIASVSYALGGAKVETLITDDKTATSGIDLTGSGIENRVVGNAGVNRLYGLGGDDELSGLGGADRLHGGAGRDALRGGAGQDRFFFDSSLDAAANVDRIADFKRVDDTIYLDRGVFGAIGSGALAGAAFRAGTAAADASDRIIHDSATGKIWYDSDGTGAAAQILFARIDAGTVLTKRDFVGYGAAGAEPEIALAESDAADGAHGGIDSPPPGAGGPQMAPPITWGETAGLAQIA